MRQPRWRKLVKCISVAALSVTATLLAATLILTPAVAVQPKFSLDQWASRTGYHFERDEIGGYVIRFRVEESVYRSEPWRVRISYNNDDKTWITVRTTVINRTSGFAFPEALVNWCLEYNNKFCGAKFAMDTKYGDIDVSMETPSSLATFEGIEWMINDVVETADSSHDGLVKLLK